MGPRLAATRPRSFYLSGDQQMKAQAGPGGAKEMNPSKKQVQVRSPSPRLLDSTRTVLQGDSPHPTSTATRAASASLLGLRSASVPRSLQKACPDSSEPHATS